MNIHHLEMVESSAAEYSAAEVTLPSEGGKVESQL